MTAAEEDLDEDDGRGMSGADEPSLDQYRGPSTGGCSPPRAGPWSGPAAQLTGRISVAEPDDAERKAIIGITGVHQPAGTKRMTVRLADLDAALSRATGLGLADVLAVLGEPCATGLPRPHAGRRPRCPDRGLAETAR